MDGNELRSIREHLKLTQEEFGQQKLGVSGSLVSKLEKGEKMNNSVALLAEILKATVRDM